MSVDKWPPKEDKDENLSTVKVESFKDPEKLESIDGKTTENQLIHDVKERAGEIGYKISPEVQEKIAEIKNSFINPDTTARDEIISTTNKRNATVETFTPDPAYQNIPERKKATGFKKWGVTTAMFLAGLFGAKAEGGKNGKNEDPKKPKQEQTIDTKSARKVNQAPTDPSYKKLGTEGDKTFYAKNTSGTLEKAKGGTPKADRESYMQEMITKVKSGISPQELLNKGYVTPEVAKELEQYVDIVYTQPEKVEVTQTKESDDPKFAKMSDRYFGPNQHAVADIWAETRASTDKADGGMLDTGQELRKIQLLDEMGNNDGEPFVLAKGELQKITGANNTTFTVSAAELRVIRDTALNKSKNDTYTLTGKEIAQGGINK